jgi:SAM-dependent methyltransferase
MIKKNSDYHDYVIKDGKLIGKFEEMYLESEEIPWHQDKTNFEWYSNVDFEIIDKVFTDKYQVKNILDIPCGLCYYTRKIKKHFPKATITAVDISETAILKCKESDESIIYHVGDFLDEEFVSSVLFDSKYDFVIIRDLLWYVTEKMTLLTTNIKRVIKVGGYLLIHQAFPVLEDNFVGKSVLPNSKALVDVFLNAGFEILYEANLFRHIENEGPIFIGMFKLKTKI